MNNFPPPFDKAPGPAKTAFLFAALLFAILGLYLLTGCSTYKAWDTAHERTYGVTYDADTKTGALSLTIRPSSSASTAPAPAAGMTDETIAKIVQIIYAQATKNKPPPSSIPPL
jgi:hypothetical protein